MSPKRLYCFALLAALNQSAFAQNSDPNEPPPGFYGSVNSSQQIVLHGTGEQVVAIDFESELGLLVPLPEGEDGPDVAPWDVALANSVNNVAFGSLLGPTVTIDGAFATNVGYTGTEPGSELDAEWISESGELTQFEVRILEPIAFSGFVNSNRKIVLVGSGEQVVAYQFRSPAGLLEPIPGGEDADVSPFELLLANEPSLVSIGTLGPAVTIEGELVTAVGYTGDNPEEELSAIWGEEGSIELNSFTVRGFVCGVQGRLPGDIDADGEVGFTDFLILSKNFGEVGSFEQGDLDCSGEVDFPDFLILSRNFGPAGRAVATVPEPGGIALVLVGLMAGGRLVRLRQSRSKLRPFLGGASASPDWRNG